MIFSDIFLNDLFKAEFEAQSAAGGGVESPQPAAGTGSPRPGHKYVKREWAGNRWKYYYTDDMQQSAHGGLAVQDYSDPNRGHSVDVHESIDTNAIDPETAYKQSVDQQLTHGAQLSLPHPGGVEGKNINIVVQVSKKGKKSFVAMDGDRPMKSFDSKGAMEHWYLRTSKASAVRDPEGNLFLKVLPNVGRVVEGELVPPSKGGAAVAGNKWLARNWIVKYHEGYPEEKRRAGRAEEYFATEELAKAAANKMVNDQKKVMGIVDQPPAQSLDNTELQSIEDAKGSTYTSEPGSVAAWIETPEKNKWKLDPQTGQPKLNVSPEKKDQLIHQAAKEFWPFLTRLANQFTNNEPFYSNKKYWMEQFIGDDIPTKKLQQDDDAWGDAWGNVPDVPVLRENSPTYLALSRALDNYNPSNGAGFAGYMIGKQGKEITGGQFYYKFLDAYNFFKQNAGVRSLDAPAYAEGGASVADQTQATPEQLESSAHLRGPESSVSDANSWERAASVALYNWAKNEPSRAPEDRNLAFRTLEKIKGARDSHKPGLIQQFNEALVDAGHGDYVVDLDIFRSIREAYEETVVKAMDVLTKDKHIDPAHTYSFKEGDDDHPRFYYTDGQGNLVRYTNAPADHTDHSSLYGDAEPHTGLPSREDHPEFFTQDGKRLNRVPGATGEQLEWNDHYNPYDVKNLWAGRWRTPAGGYEYVYVHADIRKIPKMQVHLQNTLFDARLPIFRQYVSDLFSSDKIKDQLTAVMLVLLDQGKMRALELAMLTAADVKINGQLITFGNRQVYSADTRFHTAIKILCETSAQYNDFPLFAVPQQKADGKLESGVRRRLGPHYLSCVVESQGLSLLAFQTYHATLTFSTSIVDLLLNGVPWDQAKTHALSVVALEWGHDFNLDMNPVAALQIIEQTLVDPVVLETLKKNAESIKQSPTGMQLPTPIAPLPSISFELKDRTTEEQEFSSWLHSHPIHDHVEVDEQGMYKSINDSILADEGNEVIQANPRLQRLKKEKQSESLAQHSFAMHVALGNRVIQEHLRTYHKFFNEIEQIVPHGARVEGRVKTIESCMKKLYEKPKYKNVGDLQDVTGVRVIAKTLSQALEVVDILKNRFKTVSEDDYFEHPKNDYYRAYHLIVHEDGLDKEIQVQTERQHKLAVWAHDVYKPRTADERGTLDRYAGIVDDYVKELSDFYHKKDTRQPVGEKPSMPGVVRRTFGSI